MNSCNTAKAFTFPLCHLIFLLFICTSAQINSRGNYPQGAVTRSSFRTRKWHQLLRHNQNPTSESPLVPDHSGQTVQKPWVQGEGWIPRGVREVAGSEFEDDVMVFWSFLPTRASWWPHCTSRWNRGARAQLIKRDIVVPWHTRGSKGNRERLSFSVNTCINTYISSSKGNVSVFIRERPLEILAVFTLRVTTIQMKVIKQYFAGCHLFSIFYEMKLGIS